MKLHCGDCLKVLAAMPAAAFDAVVTDPPYGLGFMGKTWDRPGVAFDPATWAAVFRVLKPGAHLLAFGGTRTHHRIWCAIEDAGFEIRDTIMWVYGSGFPKSLDVSKAIDKAAGAEREIVGLHSCPAGRSQGFTQERSDAAAGLYSGSTKYPEGVPLTAPATPAAAEWAGWGTALKPAYEPIVVARKPLSESTVAENVLKHGTGGLNIDGCRVGIERTVTQEKHGMHGCGSTETMRAQGFRPYHIDNRKQLEKVNPPGRFPANLILDGSEEVVGLFPATGGGGSGKPTVTKRERNKGWCNSSPGEGVDAIDNYGDSGSAARFFYCAKASRAEREAGLEGKTNAAKADVFGGGLNSSTRCVPGMHTPEGVAARPLHRNHHPTIKPLALMRYLCRLVAPAGATILDPFMGSGTTGIAAIQEGQRFAGIELDRGYFKIARRRIEAARKAMLRQGRLPIHD